MVKARSLLDSFRFAIDGLVHLLRTHRHARYHFALIAAVLLLALALRVSPLELALVVVVIGLVLVAELFNTAVEVMVDLATESYHPLAKVAKDVAGAAVLVASAVAVVVGAAVFLDPQKWQRAIHEPGPHPGVMQLTLVGAILVALLVVLGKLRGRRGTLIRGGVISGHSALAFFFFSSILYLTPDVLVRALAFALAFLVCQSRVDAGVHSVKEVLLGALVALVITLFLFLVLA